MLLLIISFAFYLFALWKRPFLYIGIIIQTSHFFISKEKFGMRL